MKDKIDIRVVLKAISRIQSKGKATDDSGITYRGLKVHSDFDGYTVVVSNREVSLTVLFHNKYQLTFKNRPALNDFYDTVKKVAMDSSADQFRQ